MIHFSRLTTSSCRRTVIRKVMHKQTSQKKCERNLTYVIGKFVRSFHGWPTMNSLAYVAKMNSIGRWEGSIQSDRIRSAIQGGRVRSVILSAVMCSVCALPGYYWLARTHLPMLLTFVSTKFLAFTVCLL